MVIINETIILEGSDKPNHKIDVPAVADKSGPEYFQQVGDFNINVSKYAGKGYLANLCLGTFKHGSRGIDADLTFHLRLRDDLHPNWPNKVISYRLTYRGEVPIMPPVINLSSSGFISGDTEIGVDWYATSVIPDPDNLGKMWIEGPFVSTFSVCVLDSGHNVGA